MPTGIYDRTTSRWVPWNKGIKGLVKASDETKAKLRAKRKGKTPTLGMKFSDETRRKMSEAQKAIGNKPPSHKGVAYSPEVRARMSEAQRKRCSMEDRRGEKAANWRGGVSRKHRIIRDSTESRIWRKTVLERDSHRCRHCSAEGVKLHAHHIKEFAKYPELRFDVNNGLTLCKPCHFAVHGKTYPAQVAAT